jgi:hypothetical protein
MAHTDLDVSSDLAGVYLKKSDVEDGPLTFGIQSVERVTFEAKGNRPAQVRVVLTFAGEPVRKLSLNKTNLGICVKAWGKFANKWIGQMLDVELDEGVQFAGQLVGGLRVKVRKLRRTTPPPPAEPVGVADEDDISFAFGANEGEPS